jgi:NAD(P)H-hydrate repair Nnr-like enzyme with NAD(P)H-hydrate dehydratase domain
MPDVVDDLLPAPDAVMLPERPHAAHKGTSGRDRAGRLMGTGAAYLAATAARTGAGLVKLLVADTIIRSLRPHRGHGDAGQERWRRARSTTPRTADPRSTGDGRGWCDRSDSAATARRGGWCSTSPCAKPPVIDADGLNALADSPRSRASSASTRPHPHPRSGAPTGKTIEAIAADRHGAARKAAKEWGAVLC